MRKPITLEWPEIGSPAHKRFLKERAKIDAENKKKKEKEKRTRLCTCCPIHGHELHKLK